MDVKLNPKLIKRLLNRSIAQIDQSTLANLHAAREHALNHHVARSSTLPLFAWSGGHAIWHWSDQRHRMLGSILLAVILFMGIAYWQQAMDIDDSNEDISILTDDLPIQYFVD